MQEDILLKINTLKERLKNKNHLDKKYFQLGVLYQKVDIDDEAIKSFNEVVTISPNNSEAYYRLALLLNKAGDAKESLISITRAVKLDSNNSKYYELLGNFYFRDKFYEKAEKAYLQSLSLNNSHRCNFRLSKLYDAQGLTGKAIRYVEIAIQLTSDNATYLHQLSELFIKVGYVKDALKIKKALSEQPNSPFSFSEKEVLLRCALFSGEIALIPAGFRCYTKGKIYKKLKFNQPSLPFDSGFFSPDAIAKMLSEPNVNLGANNHSVCMKEEKFINDKYGVGIKFTLSSYLDINKAVSNGKNIGRYLDSTYGYYTLDNEKKFVLAHYNWHEKASLEKSKGIYGVDENLDQINVVLNKRIERMFDLCNKAKKILFIIGNTQSYKYMQIDDHIYMLDDVSKLKKVLTDLFGNKAKIIMLEDISDADNLYDHVYSS